MAIPSKKDRRGDGKINTTNEMIHDSEEKLWEGDPMKALIYEGTERRKKLNFWSRFIITMFIVTNTSSEFVKYDGLGDCLKDKREIEEKIESVEKNGRNTKKRMSQR